MPRRKAARVLLQPHSARVRIPAELQSSREFRFLEMKVILAIRRKINDFQAELGGYLFDKSQRFLRL